MSKKSTKSEILKYRADDSEDLCKFSEMLGYGNYGCNQLQCKNGSFASSLLDFLDSNPGAVDAIVNYVKENIRDYELDEDEDEEDEEETA